jgi:Ca2+-binding RTX toxin-like protein
MAPVTDIVLLQDLSGSFGDDLPRLQTIIPPLVDNLKNPSFELIFGNNPNFGIASFVDKPVGAFGSLGDFVYIKNVPLTSDTPTIVSGVNGLKIFSGGDGPEAQLEALLQVAQDDSLNYRADSNRIALIATDAAFHVAPDGVNDPETTITRPNDGDNIVEADEDYPTIAQLKSTLDARNITPVFLVAEPTGSTEIQSTYQGLVSEIGKGEVITIDRESSDIADAIFFAVAKVREVITEEGTPGDNTITLQTPVGATPQNEVVFTRGGNDAVTTGDGNDFIVTGSGRDIARGGSGQDTLFGGLGDDTMIGGSGNDVLTDAETDNSADNLDGGSGNDIMDGRGGNDTLVGGSGDDILEGREGNDELRGGSDNDILRGGSGNDLMSGGAGNDNYAVDSITDRVSEFPDEGTDTVDSSIDYTLGADLENLSLSGSATNGTGNTLNNTITGNSANNSLNGSAGNDTLNGDAGTDTANYRALGQAITLLPRGVISKGSLGTDSILNIETIIGATGKANTINGSSGTGGASFIVNLETSPNNFIVNNLPGLGLLTFTVENFVNVTGTPENDTITGNSSNNVINGGAGNDALLGGLGTDTLVGGTGNDRLTGGAGNDRLTGGTGADRFVFNATTEARDNITDFSVVDDTINVSAAGFGGGLAAGAAITADQFRLGSVAGDSSDRFIYDSSTGGLFFDVDGNGGSGQLQLATLSARPGLTFNDIFVVA